jgi:hypothetical protein
MKELEQENAMWKRLVANLLAGAAGTKAGVQQRSSRLKTGRGDLISNQAARHEHSNRNKRSAEQPVGSEMQSTEVASIELSFF